MIVSEKGSGLGWTAVTPPPQNFFFFSFHFSFIIPFLSDSGTYTVHYEHNAHL